MTLRDNRANLPMVLGGGKISGWIRVEDEMPDSYRDVLLLDSERRCTIGFFGDCIKKWLTSIDTHGIHEGVTHWHPLPEPPKK